MEKKKTAMTIFWIVILVVCVVLLCWTWYQYGHTIGMKEMCEQFGGMFTRMKNCVR